MSSHFNPNTGTWEIGWPGRVSRHDVVYLTPPGDPMQGMPIGNGDIGALCWCEESRIILAVNKCDLWDHAQFGQFHNWKAKEEEHSTTLRHAGRIIIDFRLPVFNVFYLSSFSGRISLADASVHLRASGPFGEVSFKAFVSHDEGILCAEIESNLAEDVPVDVTLERFGSRTFSHWYRLVNRDASIGLSGTLSSCDEEGAYLTHALTSGTFAMGIRAFPADQSAVLYSREHSHAAKAQVRGDTGRRKLTLLVAVTSPSSSDAIHSVKEKLSAAHRAGPAELLNRHKQAWQALWLRSLMESGNDYLDNLWHLTMFYALSSQRGKYPGRFINGLWGWNKDVQNWNFYFHWNQQQVYWPLNAAGHHDCIDSYLDYRFNALPHGREDARELFKSDGAFVSDVCEVRGYNSIGEADNHTPVAQIAMDFWRQYRYTGDMTLLRERALPYLVEAASFFESLFEQGSDGKYHAKKGTGYEGWIQLRDGISELVYARVLFSTASEAVALVGGTVPRTAIWQKIAGDLAPLPVTVPGDECLYEENGHLRYRRGLFKGEAVCSDMILAAGIGIAEHRMLNSMIPGENDGMKGNEGICPVVEYSAVFPSGLLGLSQKGTDSFHAAVNTAKLFAPDCMGWDPLPIVLARLGLSRELSAAMRFYPDRWQMYCNGFGHYGPRSIVQGEEFALRFRAGNVRDASRMEAWDRYDPEDEKVKGGEFPFFAWPFRHMGMESMSVLSCAMNESLLQSHDGIIRVAPAVVESSNARFTLHAVGGFVVSAEIQHGKPLWISIESRLGRTCRIANPWPSAHLYRNGKHETAFSAEIADFPTRKGDRFMIVPEQYVMGNWKTEPIAYEANAAPKTSPEGVAVLGLPRMF